jgi:hypothetical protein
MKDERREPQQQTHCGLCKRSKKLYGYVEPQGQRARLLRGPDVIELSGMKIALARDFREPYREGNRSSLTACKECDATDAWPKNKNKRVRS